MPSSAVRSHPVNNKKIPVRFGISAPTSSSFPSSVRRHKTMQRGPKGSTPVVCPSTEKTKKKSIRRMSGASKWHFKFKRVGKIKKVFDWIRGQQHNRDAVEQMQ